MNDNEILERLVRMETKLDSLLISFDHHIRDHEERIRVLEASVTGDEAVDKWKYAVGFGGIALFFALVSIIVQVASIWM